MTSPLSFPVAFERLISHEGGYVHDPRDPGGETQWGLAKRSYPHLDIKALTREQAKTIYQTDYWDRLQGVPTALRFQVFDGAVHSGIGQSIRWLQRAVGVADDGVWGPASAAACLAITATPDGLHDVGLAYCAARLDFLTRLTTWEAFGKGWTRRIAANLRYLAEDTA